MKARLSDCSLPSDVCPASRAPAFGLIVQNPNTGLLRQALFLNDSPVFLYLFVITASNTVREIDLLENAIEEISVLEFEITDIIDIAPSIPEIELVCDPSAVFNKAFETLPVNSDNLLNRISANIYSVCPPGCAILVPGQKINADTLEYIRKFTDFKEIDVIM